IDCRSSRLSLNSSIQFIMGTRGTRYVRDETVKQPILLGPVLLIATFAGGACGPVMGVGSRRYTAPGLRQTGIARRIILPIQRMVEGCGRLLAQPVNARREIELGRLARLEA